MGLGGRPRTQANETTNETAAEASGLTPASPARETSLRLTHGRACVPEPVAPHRVDGRHQVTSLDRITLSDRGSLRENARGAAAMRSRGCLMGTPLRRADQVDLRGALLCDRPADFTVMPNRVHRSNACLCVSAVMTGDSLRHLLMLAVLLILTACDYTDFKASPQLNLA